MRASALRGSCGRCHVLIKARDLGSSLSVTALMPVSVETTRVVVQCCSVEGRVVC